MRAFLESISAAIAVSAIFVSACGGDPTPAKDSGGSGGAHTTSATASTGGDGAGSNDATSTTTGTGGGGSGGGDPHAPYPAARPMSPRVISGGTVLEHPKIVNVSFAGDPLEADIDAFATAIGNTTYWGDRTKEYGVDPIAPIARIHSAFAPPATFDDAAIRAWLLSELDGTHPEWPAPDGNTLYALYFPPGVTITAPPGSSCTSFHGYHDNTASLPGSGPVPYAVISRCDSIPEDPNAVGIQYVSAVASHEIIEAVTDPFVETNKYGYAETDPNHLVWSFLGLAELGDMCALIGGAFYTPADFPYLVQRIWSNQAAPTGHEPCLPEPAGQVYFNSAPVLDDTVSFDVQGQSGATKGVHIPVGETKTVEIDLYSEAPTQPWKVAVGEEGGNHLDLSLDHTSGQNGDKLFLTIHVKSKNPTYGAEIVVIQSSLGAEKNLWVGLVGN